MPMPLEYARASEDFDRFVEALRQAFGHDTRHQTYQTVESVLRIFRWRLAVEEGLVFADALPAVLRAVFVKDWDVEDKVRGFGDMKSLNAEVRSWRADHDFSPHDAIETVATVLRRHVDPIAFEKALDRLPPYALEFWKGRENEPETAGRT